MERVEYEWPADLVWHLRERLACIAFYTAQIGVLWFAYLLVSSISGLKAFRLHYLCGRSDLKPRVQLSVWTISTVFVFLAVCGSHTDEQYSRVGRTRALYAVSSVLGGQYINFLFKMPRVLLVLLESGLWFVVCSWWGAYINHLFTKCIERVSLKLKLLNK